MGLSTITQPAFRVTLKGELAVYINTFTEKTLIFCDEDGQWYHKDNGVIKSAISGFYGECYFTNNLTPTAISILNNYVKIVGTTTAGILQNFTHSSGRLTYIGVVTKAFNILSTLTVLQPTANNQTMRVGIFKNGILIPDSEHEFQNNATNAKLSVALDSVISLSANDYIEIFIKNTTALNAILVTFMNFKIN